MTIRQIVVGLVALAASQLAAAAAGSPCRTSAACIAAIAHAQDPRVGAALSQIPAIGARLLALRSYLRAAATLPQRWSWSDAQISSFAGSAHEQELGQAVDAVRREFERENPGYTVTVNPEVRSLDRQLRAWNANASVATAGREFEAAMDQALGAAATGGGIAPAAFARLVMSHTPQPSPTLAAPGLSRHGQMYAVDFHVRQGAAAVAEPDSTTIVSVWIAQGWQEKLHAAVVASASPFAGPLQDPHEPWHYDYVVPGAGAGAR